MIHQFFLAAIPIYRIGASQKSAYPAFCKLASENDTVFKTFRRYISFVDVVETLSYEFGVEFEQVIMNKYPHFAPRFNKICLDDKVGGPRQRYFNSIGWCSPTTLRYIKVAGDLEKEFGNLKKFNIVEIGGGCGGQCKVLSDLVGFSHYTIIDIPECTPLIAKFLSTLHISNVRTINNSDVKNDISSDLVISNYAFSEVDREEQWNYIKYVISLAPRGYIIHNLMQPINPFTLEEFVAILKTKNKNVRVERENPLTGEDNFVIIWHPKN